MERASMARRPRLTSWRALGISSTSRCAAPACLSVFCVGMRLSCGIIIPGSDSCRHGCQSMMLVAKRDKASSGDQSLEPAEQGTAFSPEQEKIIQEAREFCAELVDTSDATHWKTVVDKPWVKVERRSKPGSPEFLRATVTLDMDLDSAADMVCNFTHERNNWDDFMTDCEVVKEMNGEDDKIVKICFKVPLVAPRVQHSRLLITRDHPKKGEMSYMYLDWDIETDTLSSAKQGLGNGVVQAHPTDPNKVLYTSTHLMGSKFIPGFLVGWMMATFMPRMMTNQALKYRKYKGLK
mmetsp:Transcript_36860/g.94244  ORF Transcript_36860/g.94244 Transcript_36860/m.94244 type:complete len:294 (-) Transcript_36860:288-1169(-)